jgi:putative hydrolase of the HAD superfamily
MAPGRAPQAAPKHDQTVWLFDLDDTLHDATGASMRELHVSMRQYIEQHLGLSGPESDVLRRSYWKRYGATLLGLVRHHAVKPAHFLHQTHVLPGLEQRVRGAAADIAALRRLPGRKVLVTNAPRAYAERVLRVLGIGHLFDGVRSIEDMHMFGDLRPKPDARMLRWLAAGLHVAPARCVLVEDTLAHQKAARRVGMGTGWMQRWLRGPGRAGRLHRRPAYVDRRIRRLRELG